MYGQRNTQLFASKEEEEIDSNQQQRRSKSTTISRIILRFAILLRLTAFIIVLLIIFLYKTFKKLFKKSKSLRGKICLVTGTGRGLGRGLAVALAKLGATVVCVDIREDANNETVKLIKDSDGTAYGYTCNVAKYEEVIKLAKTVQIEVGRVFLLLNNAGLIMTHKAGEWSPEEVTSMFSVNSMSHCWMVQAFLPAMKEHNEGHIANVISISSFFPMPALSIYGATKAAAEYLLCTLRMELNFNKDNRIIVSGIFPSVINTSDDIKYLYQNDFFGAIKLEQAVAQIIKGIRYDRTTIVVPDYFQWIINCARFLPESLIIKSYEIFNISVNLPSEEYKEKMPFYEILHKCT